MITGISSTTGQPYTRYTPQEIDEIRLKIAIADQLRNGVGRQKQSSIVSDEPEHKAYQRTYRRKRSIDARVEE